MTRGCERPERPERPLLNWRWQHLLRRATTRQRALCACCEVSGVKLAKLVGQVAQVAPLPVSQGFSCKAAGRSLGGEARPWSLREHRGRPQLERTSRVTGPHVSGERSKEACSRSWSLPPPSSSWSSPASRWPIFREGRTNPAKSARLAAQKEAKEVRHTIVGGSLLTPCPHGVRQRSMHNQ